MSQSASSGGAASPSLLGRIFGALALAVAVVLVLFLLLGNGGSGYSYKLLFETGGQLVPGNQVQVAGQPIGTVDSIDLTEDAQAEVAITVEEPLHEGTTAVVRLTSLSGVANRYVALSLGPNNMPEIGEGGTIQQADTTSPVDLDQLFDLFRQRERKALQKFIQGNATAYAGRQQLANRAYKFLNPALSTSERLFAELSSDSLALERFLVQGAKTFGAIADRRDDLTSLVSDGNTALGAVANQNEALERSLVALPGTLRQANTTFVNLRTTLDDLDPLVEVSYPATEDLAPFLRRFEQLATDGRPVFRNLADVVKLPGADNDLREALAALPKVKRSGDTAFPAAIDAMDSSQPNLEFIRPYVPDLFGLFSKLGETTAYYDANGHYARVNPSASNIYEYNSGTNSLDPIYTDRAAQYDALDFGVTRRCPGGGTQQSADLSNPFVTPPLAGGLAAADCNPADLPPEGP